MATVSLRHDNKGWLLSSAQIQRLQRSEYHYNAWSQSLLDPLHQPFWHLVVEVVPLWITPSVLTACGVVASSIGTAATLYYAPNLREPLPPSIQMANAVCIFLYQTFDGIDGKQSYRNQVSELEEYTDHAADAISTVFIALQLGGTLQLGEQPQMLVILLILAMVSFWSVHWAALATRTICFGRIDVTEAQWGAIAIHLTTALYGKAFWTQQILSAAPLEGVLQLTTASLLFYTVGNNIMMATGFWETPLERNDIRIPRIKPHVAAILSTASLTGCSILCASAADDSRLLLPVLLLIGLTFAKVTASITFNKVSDTEPRSIDLISQVPMLLFMCSYRLGIENLQCIAWLTTAATTVMLFWFHYRACSDLAEARDIAVFSLKYGSSKTYQFDHGFYVAGDNFKPLQRKWRHFLSDGARFEAKYSKVPPD